jgi:hypothetical protein
MIGGLFRRQPANANPVTFNSGTAKKAGAA